MDITERQRAAFAIAANMAQSQFAKAVATQHFYALLPKGESSYPPTIKALVEKLRNFFSHAEHAGIDALSADEKIFFEGLYARSKAQFLARRQQAVEPTAPEGNAPKLDDQATAYLSTENAPAIAFDGKVSELPQTALAFMLAPFLSRKKAQELCQRIHYGGEKHDSDKTAAIKSLIRQVAHPDNISLRAHDDEEVQWLTSAQIWALSLWDRLEQHYQSGQDLPEHYYCRQLIDFIESQAILPCQFEHITTTASEADGKTMLTQTRAFIDRGEPPLNIKFNTIASQWAGGMKGTFSIKALEIIALAYLINPKAKQDIGDKVGTWLAQNQNYEHKKPAGRNRDEDLDDAIKNRCDYLIRQYEAQKPQRDYEQIRFICQRIAVVWEKSHGKKPNKAEYEDLREKIYAFNKDYLFTYLQSQGVRADSSGIELGRGNDKVLRKVITKQTIQDVYNDMAKAYCDYLKGVKEGVHKRSDDEKSALAKRLGCRIKSVQNPQNRPNSPVGIPPKLLRYMLLDDKSDEGHQVARIENLLKQIGNRYPCAFAEPKLENKSAQRKAWQIWNRKQISLAMAWHILSEIPGNEQKVQRVEGFLNLAKIPISLKIENRAITMKMGKSWRKHTHFPKGYLGAVIKHYAGDKKQVPMFRADETQGAVSIETASQECESERLFLIEAALHYETEWRRKNKASIESKTNAEGYIKFGEMCDNRNANHYRREAFHGRVLKFSACPEPLKSLYDALVKKKQERQNRAKKQNWSRKK